MKKVFRLEDLCCAHCATKIEDAIRKLEGVNDVNVTFLTQKLTIDANDDCFDEIFMKAVKIIKRIEPDCKIVK